MPFFCNSVVVIMVAADPTTEAATNIKANFKFFFMCFLSVKLLLILIFSSVNFNVFKTRAKCTTKNDNRNNYTYDFKNN